MKFFIATIIASVAFLHLQAQDTLQQELVIGVKETPPFVIQNEDGSYSGLSVDLWNSIASEMDLPFRYKTMELPDLLAGLENDEIDVSINPLTVTSSRVRAFNFTQPFFITTLAIATQKKDTNAIWAFVKNMFSPAFLKVVMLLFVVILVFGLLAWLFERRVNPDEFEPGWKGLWSGIWWSAVTMTTVGYGDKSPKSIGGRIVGLIWMFTAIVIISGFTASIASSLTIEQLNTDISGPDDLKEYHVITVKGSTSEKYLGRKGIEFTSYDDPVEALKLLADGKADAMVYDAPVLRYLTALEELEEEVIVLPHQFNTQYYGFSVSKKQNPLLESINPLLLKTIEDVKWKATLNDYHLLD